VGQVFCEVIVEEGWEDSGGGLRAEEEMAFCGDDVVFWGKQNTDRMVEFGVTVGDVTFFCGPTSISGTHQ